MLGTRCSGAKTGWKYETVMDRRKPVATGRMFPVDAKGTVPEMGV